MAKYNTKTVNLIQLKLKEGCTKKQAAVLAGIDESTFYDWVSSKPKFSQSVEQAIEEYKEKLIKVINVGSISKPMVALTVLARRWPEEWGGRFDITSGGEKIESPIIYIPKKKNE